MRRGRGLDSARGVAWAAGCPLLADSGRCQARVTRSGVRLRPEADFLQLDAQLFDQGQRTRGRHQLTSGMVRRRSGLELEGAGEPALAATERIDEGQPP